MNNFVRYITLLIAFIVINKYAGFEYTTILFMSLLLTDTYSINANVEKIKEMLKDNKIL